MPSQALTRTEPNFKINIIMAQNTDINMYGIQALGIKQVEQVLLLQGKTPFFCVQFVFKLNPALAGNWGASTRQ